MPICPYCKEEKPFSQTSSSMFRCSGCQTEYLDSYFFSLPREIAVLPKPVLAVRTGIPVPESSLPEAFSEGGPEDPESFPTFPPLESRAPFMASGYDVLRWFDFQFGTLENFSCLKLIASILHLSVTELQALVADESINRNRVSSLYVPRYCSFELASRLFRNFLSEQDLADLPAKCHRNLKATEDYNLLAVLAYIEKVMCIVEYQTVRYSPTGTGRTRLLLA